MMRGLLFVVCSLWLVCGAQRTFRPEAKWWYDHDYYSAGSKSYALMTIEGDTIISGTNCKELKIDGTFAPTTYPYLDYYFVYEDSDRVFYWDGFTNQFQMLYDLSLPAGSSYTLNWSGTQVTAHVDSVYTVQINGVNLRAMNLNAGSMIAEFSGKIIEAMGHTGYFFPTTDNFTHAYGLRCYEDSVIGHYLATQLPACDYVTGVVSSLLNTSIRISPNPATPTLTLNTETEPAAPTYFQLFDLTGRMVLQQSIAAKSTRIEVNAMSKGMYLYSVLGEKEKLGTGKVVIE